MQLKDEIRFYLYFDKKGIDSIYHQFPDSDSNYTETTVEHINGNFDMDLDISSLLHMATWASETSAGVGRDIKREQPIEISYEEKVKCIENHLDVRCIGFLPDLLKNLSRHTSSLIACRGLFKLTEAVVGTTGETISTYEIQRNPYSYDQLSFDFISTPIPGDFSRGEIMQKAMKEYGYYVVEMYLSGVNIVRNIRHITNEIRYGKDFMFSVLGELEYKENNLYCLKPFAVWRQTDRNI